jgi:Uma2 family endonuclease
MATVADAPPSTWAAGLAPIQYMLLRDIDWATYRAVSDALGERHLRFAFDGSNLELMTTSHLHGVLSRFLGRIVEALSEEFGLPIRSCGDFTLNRADLDRGLQPDECFYLRSEPLIRAKDELDFTADPPPDLAVEIDVSRSSLNRLAIYAALGVPEVWRFDGTTLECRVRAADGRYASVDRSQNFPGLRPEDLVPFLLRFTQADLNALIREVRTWVRGQIAAGWGGPA